MKYISRALVILSVLISAGCALPPEDQPPKNAGPMLTRVGFAVEVYSPRDPDRPGAERIPKIGRIDVDLDATDSFGGKGTAGQPMPFHDPSVSTPYFFGFTIQVGLAVHITGSVTYFGQVGDTVRCWFEDASGNEELSTRREADVIRLTPDQQGGIALVTCEELIA